MPEFILHWGIDVIVSLQSLGEWLIAPMNALTFTGNLEFFLLILPALYWCVDRRLGIRVSLAVVLGAALSVLLKTGLHGPRPYWFDSQALLWSEAETTFGLPSAHAQGAVVFWGLLAAFMKKRWAWTLAILLMLSVGVSRIVIGVHFPTDVLAGWSVGGLILWLILAREERFMSWFGQKPASFQALFLSAISFAIVALGIVVYSVVQTIWSVPEAWLTLATQASPDTALNPFSFDVIVVCGGFVFGLAFSRLALHTDFHPGGSWALRLSRYIIGIFILFALWKGLDYLFAILAEDETFFGYILRYIRYAIMSAWIWGLAPKLFLRLRLAEPMERIS